MTEYSKLYTIIRTLNDNDETFWTRAHDDGTIHIEFNCNDLFYWGCSDSEEVAYDDLVDYGEDVRDLIPFDQEYLADALFAARKRNQRPQGAFLKDLKNN
jgi:hypothetical protein